MEKQKELVAGLAAMEEQLERLLNDVRKMEQQLGSVIKMSARMSARRKNISQNVILFVIGC